MREKHKAVVGIAGNPDYVISGSCHVRGRLSRIMYYRPQRESGNGGGN